MPAPAADGVGFVTVKRVLARAALIAAILVIAFSLYALPKLGRFLVAEDPLTKSDAIYVLSGARFERLLEAIDLYQEGWAPKIVLVQGMYDWGELELIQKGVAFQKESDIQVQLGEALGVPREAFTVLGQQDSTHDEALTLFDEARRQQWTKVIVVTSKQHTRRARMEFNRTAGAGGLAVVMRATRHDRSDVDQWWRSRGTIRFTLFETQRLIAYWLHLAY